MCTYIFKPSVSAAGTAAPAIASGPSSTSIERVSCEVWSTVSPVSDRGAIEAVEGRVSSVFESHDAIFDVPSEM